METSIFKVHLLSTSSGKAMLAAFFPDDSETLQDMLDNEPGCSKFAYESLCKARPRLDIACMLLERREWLQGKWKSSASRSIHPTIDSSPTSGKDIFGGALDVWIDNDTYERVILPGSNLGHGFTSVVDKAVAFLWGIWLICGGVDMRTFEAVLLDMRSICTDMGAEAGVAHLPNFLAAWATSHGLPVSPSFQLHKRLFPLMVSIPDCNHMCSNIVKRLFTPLVHWPFFLAHMRALLKIFKNDEYRSTIRQWLTDNGKADIANTLLRCSASFAHWRYETLYTVLKALNQHRYLCEVLFSRKMLGEVADGASLKAFVAACEEPKLWRWIAAVLPIARQLDRFREWSRGCSCHEEQLRRGQPVECKWLGKRLREYPEHVQE